MIRNRIAEMLKKGTCVGLAAALIMSATVPAATSVAEAAEPVQNSEVMVNAENASPVSEEKENIDENTTTTTENQNNVSASDNENFIKAESIENIGSLQQPIKLNAKNVSNVPVLQADEIYSTRITLNKHEASIDEGKTFQLTVNSFSGNATNKEIIWTTSDSTVATVDQNGLVTAVGAGDCNITATCVGKNEGMDAPASATCVIHADYQYDYLDPEEKTSVRITDYTGSDTEITIPGNINGKVVNEIGTYAFWMDDNITKVVIPEGVTTIGDDAFRGDDNLASITFPSTLKKIGEGAFYSNAFTEVVIPEGTTRIERGAFNDCDQLANVSLPSTLTYIGANAFAGCTALDKIVLPDRISGISTNPFGSGVELIDKIYANAGSTTAKTLEKNNITYIAIAYPQSITLSDSNLELISGKDATLTVTEVTGDPEPTNTDVEWKSSDENVATVDENGNIKAVGEGTATITATCVGKNVDEENYASASCTVKVLGIEKNFTYSTNEDNEIVIEGYDGGYKHRPEIPSEIEGLPVTAIADNAFVDVDAISTVTLPNSIKSVGENAFGNLDVYARNNTTTAETLKNAGVDYLSIVTVTLSTEFYNRDGSLSDEKGGTSTYERYEGDRINMGTATFASGWILETESVTGMEDTNDALYKAEGTVGKEDITIKYIWHEDNIGPEGEGDKIADKYQVEVSFDVANGTWNDGTTDTINAVLTLVDENGNPDENGMAVSGIPEVGNVPAEGFVAGNWSANMLDGITKDDQGANFVYNYIEKQVEPTDPTDPTNPTDPSDKPSDGEDTTKPGNDNPDKDVTSGDDKADVDKNGDKTVETGDESDPAMTATLALLAGGAAIGTGMAIRRKRED